MSDLHMDPAVVSALRDVMEGGFSDLLDTFIADSDERLQQLHLARGPTELMAVAHSFKGSSSNMGAIRLARLCAELEAGVQKMPVDGIEALVLKIDREYQTVRRLYSAERKRCGVAHVVSH